MENEINELIFNITAGIKGIDSSVAVFDAVITCFSDRTLGNNEKERFLRVYENLRLSKYAREVENCRLNVALLLKDFLDGSINVKEYELKLITEVEKIEEASLQNRKALILHQIHFGTQEKVKEYQNLYYDLKNIKIGNGLDYLIGESIEPDNVIRYIKSSSTRYLENGGLNEQKSRVSYFF